MNSENFKMWVERDFSWSQISSFEYSPEQWYLAYYLRKRGIESPEMKFGKLIGERVANDPTFIPEWKRHSIAEHEFRVIFDDIKLVGFADFFCGETRKKIDELKTGVKPWDQKRVDEHGQLDMYCFMHYIKEKIKPEDMELRLVWLPTEPFRIGHFKKEMRLIEPVIPQYFPTKRTMTQVLQFGTRIKETRQAMMEYIKTVDNDL